MKKAVSVALLVFLANLVSPVFAQTPYPTYIPTYSPSNSPAPATRELPLTGPSPWLIGLILLLPLGLYFSRFGEEK